MFSARDKAISLAGKASGQPGESGVFLFTGLGNAGIHDVFQAPGAG